MGRGGQSGASDSGAGRRGDPEISPPFLGPFRDRPESAFYASGRLTPQETFNAAEENIRAGLIGVRNRFPGRRLRMDHERLTRYHRSIFGKLFTEFEGAGRYRQGHEPTQFAVPVRRPSKWTAEAVRGSPYDRIRSELNEVFAAWDARIDQAQGRRIPPREALLAVAELYTGILRIHPFVDGNHRASFMTYAAAMWSFDIPLVRFRDAGEMRAHDRAVAPALLPDQRDSRPFAGLLLKRSEAARS